MKKSLCTTLLVAALAAGGVAPEMGAAPAAVSSEASATPRHKKAAPAAAKLEAAPGLSFRFAGQNNCFVTVDPSKGRLLLLPIQESVPDADINIIVDGRIVRNIKARLAVNHVDYYVPLNVQDFAQEGLPLLLDVRTADGGHRSHDIRQELAWKDMKLSNTFSTENTEKYRPAFHHTPLWGWMNDPNGMFYKDGVWHLYYQHNPYGSLWQNLSWGHSTSKDLVNWEHQPEAVEPNALGMVFSGSSVVDHANTAGFGEDAVVALYTSAGNSQVQSLAHSTDNGETFDIYPGNPVIVYDRETRDPNMFWDAKNNRWVLLLASALDHEMVILTSPDLKDWTVESKFGRGYGSQEGVWECPDLFELPIEGTNKSKWVLVCNINPGGPFGGSGTQYFVGDFDGTTFTADTRQNVTKWMDYGKDHYATVSFSNAPDGRVVVVPWMSNWQYANDVPTRQFRSANGLPRDLGLFRDTDGGLYVSVKPSPEVEALRVGEPMTYTNATLSTDPTVYPLPKDNAGICEIVLDVDMRKTQQLDLVLSNPTTGEEVVMTYDTADRSFSMDRTESGLTEFSTAFPAVTVAPLHSNAQRQTVRLFVDRSSIEAFGGQGRWAMTNLVFPSEPYTQLSLQTTSGTAKLVNLEIYPLKSSL